MSAPRRAKTSNRYYDEFRSVIQSQLCNIESYRFCYIDATDPSINAIIHMRESATAADRKTLLHQLEYAFTDIDNTSFTVTKDAESFMALAALETGKRSASEITNDTGSWAYGGHTFRSHGDAGLGPVDMVRSIVLSSNVYYYSLANTMGVDAIHDFMKPLGFGQVTGIDLPGELKGVLPSTQWKKNAYKKPEQQRWYGGETISLGIGQGYNTFTMLQLAGATATLANGGQQNTPRLVVATQDPIQRVDRPLETGQSINLGYKSEHVAVIRQGLVGVAKEGTAARVFAGTPYQSAGKTGTAQAVTIGQKDKYNASKLEEHQRDHALYMAFAPAENPQIALAIVVENAGFGAAQAAPIARRVFDYWLLGEYPSVEDIEASQKGLAVTPVGTKRRKEDVQLISSEGVATPMGKR